MVHSHGSYNLNWICLRSTICIRITLHNATPNAPTWAYELWFNYTKYDVNCTVALNVTNGYKALFTDILIFVFYKLHSENVVF